MGATNLQTHSRIHHTHNGSRLWEKGLFLWEWKDPGGEVCFFFLLLSFQVAFRISWCRPVIIGGSKSKLQPWMVLHMVWRVASFDATYCWRSQVDSYVERGGSGGVFVVEKLVVKRESKTWCCGHLRQRIKVLHPVICPLETCLFSIVRWTNPRDFSNRPSLVGERQPDEVSHMFRCKYGCLVTPRIL